jgi:predicted ATPase
MEKLQYIQTMQDTGEELANYVDENGERLSTFGPILRVNILVGATNSGKSRFMRGLAKSPGYVSFPLDPSVARPDSMLSACEGLSHKQFQIDVEANLESHEYDLAALVTELPWLEEILKPAQAGPQQMTLKQHDFRRIKSLLVQELTKPGGGTDANRRRAILSNYVQAYRFALQTPDGRIADKEWLSLRKEGLTEDSIRRIEGVLNFVEALLTPPHTCKITPPEVVYIPVLRTAVPLKEISTSDTADYLGQSISENYGLGSAGGKVEVFTGNLLYWTINKELRSDKPETRNRLKSFERFLGETFYEGMSINLVPLNETGGARRHLALHVGEQIMRRFCDIGDGIQAIIILMYRLFTAEPGTWIFIEEPEQGLHPGLQRIFLETLARHRDLQDRDLTVFMSTHSNHLLGIAISELKEDVSVFAFQKCPGWSDPERFEVRPIHTRQANLLTLLGVANSSVFLANCSIWVEGITDRKYLRAYLSAYLLSDEFKREYSFTPQEDVHYAFFEYAGSNLEHYLFESKDGASADQVEQIRAQFLCNRIFLLADRDESKEEKHKRYEAWSSESFRYFVTPGIEVENLISEAELVQALPQLISGLTGEQVTKAGIRLSDYRRKRIGSYLTERFGHLCPNAVKAGSGTLSAYYKDKLANLVCPNVTWENMSDDARDLTRALYNFIYKHNQGVPRLGS